MDKSYLKKLYLNEKLSMKEISLLNGCSVNRVSWWLHKHHIPVRTRSDASYVKHNPLGDPFKVSDIDTLERAILYGEGIGLYWGEGTKSDKHNVRLGNSDVELIKKFILFLKTIYNIQESKLRFALQLFNDIDTKEAEEYWSNELGYPLAQFYKTRITVLNRNGTYRKKSKYGVLTLYYPNVKLRNLLVDALPANGVKYISE